MEPENRCVFGFFCAPNYDARICLVDNDADEEGSIEKEENDEILTYFDWRKQRIQRAIKVLKK